MTLGNFHLYTVLVSVENVANAVIAIKQTGEMNITSCNQYKAKKYTAGARKRQPVSSASIQLFRERLSEKNVHATIPKGNMGYDRYIVPDTVAVELSFVAFL